MPASTQCGVASAALVIVLSGNACPMIDSVAQSNVRGVAHDYDMRLAAAFRHGRNARQSSERLIIAAAERPRSLGKQYGENDLADSRHGLQYLHIVPSATAVLSRR